MVSKFKTRTEIGSITMPRVLGNNQHKRRYIVALDGGYSSVKGLSENTISAYKDDLNFFIGATQSWLTVLMLSDA